MTCSEVRELAAAYCLDALTRHERQRVDQHLDRCSRCRREVASLSEAAAGLARLVPPGSPPPALRARVLEQARPTARPAASASTAPATPRSTRAGRLPALVAYAGAAALLFAAGWAAGRMGPGPVDGQRVGARRLIAAARIQQELWQAIAGPGLAVRPLEVDPGLRETVAFVSLAGDSAGCRLNVVAEGVPAPPRGFAYEAWVWLRSGSVHRIGRMQPTGPGRFELAARVAAPAGELEALQVWLAPVPPAPGVDAAGGGPPSSQPHGHKVIWGKLWAPAAEDRPAGPPAW